MSFFRTEWISWKAVLQARCRSVVFFSILSFFFLLLTFAVAAQFRLFSDLVEHVTSQVEVIVELKENLPDEERVAIEGNIRKLPLVKEIEYWDSKKSAQYVNTWLLKGYEDFVFPGLFRIQLKDIADQKKLISLLQEQYPDQLHLPSRSLSETAQSFSSQFIQSISISHRLFQMLMVLQVLAVLLLMGYLVILLIQERKKGFHPLEFLHLSPAFLFFPAFLLLGALGLCIIFLAAGVASFLFSGLFLRFALLIFFLYLGIVAVIMAYTRQSS